MNGATPSGPIAWVTSSASERTAACAGTGRREKRGMIASGEGGGGGCGPAAAGGGAPGEKGPARPVPEAADQHRQHQVAVREEPAAAISPERDVEVVAQPARERHVPAAPEVLDRDRRVRGGEVLREGEGGE